MGSNFYSRPCGRGDCACACAISCWWIFLLTPLREGRLNRAAVRPEGSDFYSRPCGRGDRNCAAGRQGRILFLLTPLREGRRVERYQVRFRCGFLLTPLREGRRFRECEHQRDSRNFYSRPCGRGDSAAGIPAAFRRIISTHAPAGGATGHDAGGAPSRDHFYSRPCGRGDTTQTGKASTQKNFYSRPCGRGDQR